MGISVQLALLALCMALFSVLPMVSSWVRQNSRRFFLMGTGAMLGICFFDLIPEVRELGGNPSLYVMGMVWFVYLVIHVWRAPRHGHDLEGALKPGFWFFIGSLLAHCVASGMLLVVSNGLSQRIAFTVLIALIAHKCYEALLLSSVLIEQKKTMQWKLAIVAAYTSSLPVGALLALQFGSHVGHTAAVLISSVAVGTLLGCLVFDFLLPSIQQLKTRRIEILWVLAGLVLTQVIVSQLSKA